MWVSRSLVLACKRGRLSRVWPRKNPRAGDVSEVGRPEYREDPGSRRPNRHWRTGIGQYVHYEAWMEARQMRRKVGVHVRVT